VRVTKVFPAASVNRMVNFTCGLGIHVFSNRLRQPDAGPCFALFVHFHETLWDAGIGGGHRWICNQGFRLSGT